MARGKADDQTDILEYALKHLETERDRIEARIESIRRQLGRTGKASVRAVSSAAETEISIPVRKKRVLSEAARKRIAAAQKRRWAEHRRQQVATA